MIVTGKASIAAAAVTDMHLIGVPDLFNVMNRIYGHAARLTYLDVDHGVPEFLTRSRPAARGQRAGELYSPAGEGGARVAQADA